MTQDWRAHGRWRPAPVAGSAASGGGHEGPVSRRIRPWLVLIAAALSLAAVLPPAATYARQYALVQAVQFVAFAVLTPASLALSLPRRLDRQHRASRPRALRKRSLAAAAAWRLVPFMTLAITWRLPHVLHGLARYPVLSAVELVTLVAAGTGVWLAITDTTPEAVPRPLQAVMAAFAVWTIWIVAYVTGMSAGPLIPRSAAAAYVISAAADRQLAAAVLWAVPAVCFAPTIYFLLMSWLGDRDGQEDQPHEVNGQVPATLIRARRPPPGWRHRASR